MDPITRAILVRQARFELKQDADEEQRQRNARRWLRTVDRNRPRLTRNSTDADRATIRRRVADYEADRGRRGGYAAGEAIRANREAGGYGIDPRSDAHAELSRRSNVRLIGRTQMTGGTRGIVRTLTPAQRTREAGVLSRRRRVSPGLVPEPRAPQRRR